MKEIILWVVMLALFNQTNLCAQSNNRIISEGTILNYTIKDGKVSYRLKATVSALDKEGDITIQWQTTGGKTMKGTCVQLYSSLDHATAIKMKLKPGNENLNEETTRWFIGYNIYDKTHNSNAAADLYVDGEVYTFFGTAQDSKKDILYNKVKTSMDIEEATATEIKTPITTSFIEYADEIILLDAYDDGKFSMKLVSIESPVQKTLEQFTEELMKAMAPKGTVPLKKMEAAKFAKVKAKYPLLAAIENYDGTKNGTVKKPIAETYEFRVESKSAIPPSLVDCFTADLQILYNQKQKFDIADAEAISTKSLPAATAKKLLEIYLKKRYNDIPGYRPWTHWSFVNSFSESQRAQLATELESYIATYGFSE